MNPVRRRLLALAASFIAWFFYNAKRINDKVVDRLGDRLADLAEKATFGPPTRIVSARGAASGRATVTGEGATLRRDDCAPFFTLSSPPKVG